MTDIATTQTSFDTIDAGEWNLLASRSSTNTIFQTHAWNRAWWEAFGPRYRSALISVRESGRLVGLAPLVIDSQGVLRFLGHGASDYVDLLVDQGRDDVLDALLRAIRDLDWKSIHFEQLHEHSPIVRRRLPIAASVEVQQPAPSYRFTHGDEDRKLANKKSLKRHFNYFDRSGNLRFEVLEDETAVLPHLELFFQQHIERRALTHAPSRFRDPSEREFYGHLAHALGESRQLRFGVLRYDDEILGYHFGFEFEGTFYWYKPTFNVRFEKHSPGEVLIKSIIEDCIRRGVNELDFTIGGEAFKYRFANQQRTVYMLKGFRNRLGLGVYTARRQLGRTLRDIRQRTARQHDSA